jgi:hypothetical protein
VVIQVGKMTAQGCMKTRHDMNSIQLAGISPYFSGPALDKNLAKKCFREAWVLLSQKSQMR